MSLALVVWPTIDAAWLHRHASCQHRLTAVQADWMKAAYA
ncbi:MAG: hypothetical protein ACI8UD_003454, partial [Planctomycetota bacterium]